MIDLSRVLITGGKSMISSSIRFGIKMPLEELDVTKSEEINEICNKINPSAIIALSSLDLRLCEDNPFEAYKVNVLGIYNLALEAKKRDIPLVMISTGAIFNGNLNDIFKEEDLPCPQNIYGQTKYLAEIIVKNILTKYLILRTGWIYGATNSSRLNFIDKMITSAKNNEEIQATTDQVGSPTYILDFAKELEELLKTEKTGTYHLVNKGKASAHEIAKHIIKTLNSKSKLNSIQVSDLPKKIKRSASEALESDFMNLRNWQAALEDYLSTLQIK